MVSIEAPHTGWPAGELHDRGGLCSFGGLEVDLSEALTKVAIMLSLAAAAYFVVVELSNDDAKSRFSQDDETARLSQVLATWA